MNSVKLLLVLAGILATTESRASIYTCCGNPVKRASPDITFNRTLTSFPTGGAYTNRLIEAAAVFQTVRGSSASASVVVDADDLWSPTNGIDEATWALNAPNNSVIAQVMWRFSNGVYCDGHLPCCNGCTAPTLVETDLVFYAKRQNGTDIVWNSNRPVAMAGTSVSPDIYFTPTAVHEIAHSFGIDHDTVNVGMSTMDPGYPFGGWLFGNRSAGHHWPE
jgi:hypothetical protein